MNLDALDRPAPVVPQGEPEWAELVLRKCAALRFGSIEITVEDSQIVRIEQSSRSRVNLEAPSPRFRSAHRTKRNLPES